MDVHIELVEDIPPTRFCTREPREPINQTKKTYKKYVRDMIAWGRLPENRFIPRYSELWKLSLATERPQDDPIEFYKLENERKIIYNRRMIEHQREERTRLGDDYNYDLLGLGHNDYHPDDPHGWLRDTPDLNFDEHAVTSVEPELEVVGEDNYTQWGRQFYGENWHNLRMKLIWEAPWVAEHETIRRTNQLIAVEREVERTKTMKLEKAAGWSYEKIWLWVST